MSTAVSERIIIDEGRHSRRGASSAHRWRNCAGSINLTERLINDGHIEIIQNHTAAEGTAAHLVLSSCLEDGSDAVEMSDMIIEVGEWSFAVDDEMVRGVQEVLDWTRDRINRAKEEGFEVHVHIEKGLESFTDEDAFGTSDIVIHIVGDRLIIVDFKYGRGITVEPTSDQNYYYCYLAVENYLNNKNSVKVVESWIAQPRIPHPDGTIRRHVTNVNEVTEWWFNQLLPDMEATRDPDAPLTIGEHCRFCPNKGHCPALKAEVFEFPVGIDPSHLTDTELGEVLLKLEAIEAVKGTFEAEAFNRARRGLKIPGRKLVRKRSNREWKVSQAIRNPDTGEMAEIKFKDAVKDIFGPDAYKEPDFRSPAQLEKLEGGSDFTILWAFTPNKGLTLAAERDKRPEIRPDIERHRGVHQ